MGFQKKDRFSTFDLLTKAQGLFDLDELFPETVKTIEQRTAYITELESKLAKDRIIHGDLGSWNMLFDENKLYVIDFGECRKGDIHFDLAAIICGILAKCNNANDFSKRISLFLDTYKSVNNCVIEEKLHIAVYLWLLRGALASVCNIQTLDKVKKKYYFFTCEIKKYIEFTKCDIK